MPYREPPPIDRPCPRCGVPLTPRRIAEAALAECERCGGAFVTAEALEWLIGDDSAEVRAALPGGVTSLHPDGPMYVPCPACGQLMQRRQFALGANVVIDVCRPHGTWFDGHELGNVLAFVDGGGLVRARKKEEARRAEEERAARAPRVRTPFEVPSEPGPGNRAATSWGLLARLFRSLRR